MASIKLFLGTSLVLVTLFALIPQYNGLKCYVTEYNETHQGYNYSPELFECDEESYGPNPGCVMWIRRGRLRYGCWRQFDVEDNFGDNWCRDREACACLEDGCNKMHDGSPNCKDCIDWESQGRYFGLKNDDRYI